MLNYPKFKTTKIKIFKIADMPTKAIKENSDTASSFLTTNFIGSVKISNGSSESETSRDNASI